MIPLRAFMLTALLTAVSLSVPAAVLIKVDVSNPAAVTFTATGAHSLIDDASTTTLFGVTLLEFFEENIIQDSTVPITGNLTPSGATAAYNVFYVDGHPGSGSFKDLNLFRETRPSDTQKFQTTAAAFSGTATINFLALSMDHALPAPGDSGKLLAGYSLVHGGIIGHWTVVPEVSPAVQAGVMGAVLLGWLTWRRQQFRPGRRQD